MKNKELIEKKLEKFILNIYEDSMGTSYEPIRAQVQRGHITFKLANGYFDSIIDCNMEELVKLNGGKPFEVRIISGIPYVIGNLPEVQTKFVEEKRKK